MNKYKKVKTVRLNVFENNGVIPVGAFVKGSQITPGWVGQNQRVEPVQGLCDIVNSYTGDCLLAVDGSGKVYMGDRENGTELNLLYDDGEGGSFIFHTSEKDTDLVVAVNGNKFTYVRNKTVSHGELPYALSGGVVKKGRLFATDSNNKFMIRWSGPDGWRDWESGSRGCGSLVFKPVFGFLKEIINFKDYLVIFAEYGIIKMSVSGDPKDFKPMDAVKIPLYCGHTAVNWNGNIYFVTEAGLMRYNGARAEKIEGLISDDIRSAVYGYLYKNRYYFVCGTSAKLKRKTVYVYDLVNDACQIADVPAYALCHDKESMLGYTETTIYRLRLGYGLNYNVSLGAVDFGTPRRKLATVLEVDCDPDVTLEISNEKHTRKIDDPNGKTRINMRGAEFWLEFSSGTGSVRSAYLTAEVEE